MVNTFLKVNVSGRMSFFYDEPKFNLCGSDSKAMVPWWKSNQNLKTKNLKATVKHSSSSATVRGCTSAEGFGNYFLSIL